MAANNIPRAKIPQVQVFYTKEWTFDVDTKFVSLLLQKAVDGKFAIGCNHRGTIRKITSEINNEFNTSFDYKFYYERVKKQRYRYSVFKWILNLSGVSYNAVTNKVSCDPHTWDHIRKTERLGLAYIEQGEPEFAALCTIFQGEEDSIGYFQLEPITHISSPLNSLSACPSIQFPRMNEASTDTSFWNYIARYVSENESDAATHACRNASHKVCNEVRTTSWEEDSDEAHKIESNYVE